MNLDTLNGLVAILPTPFTDDGKIDENGLRRLVRAAIEKQLDGVVVLGSNAAFPYLRMVRIPFFVGQQTFWHSRVIERNPESAGVSG